MIPIFLAAALAAGAVLVAGPGRPLRSVPDLSRARRHRTAAWPWRSGSGAVPRAAWPVLVGVVLVAPASMAGAAVLAAVALVVLRQRTARAAAGHAGEVALVVAEGATALAADLTAGHVPLAAIAALASECAAEPSTAVRVDLAARLHRVASTGRLGGDVPTALRTAAAAPGAGGLRDLAAGWQVAEVTGAGLAVVLEQVAQGLRRQQVARRRIAGALGAARASARLLVMLPALGLLIGAGLGVSPAHFLLGPLAGRLCLVVGLGLSLLGVRWTDRLAEQASAMVRQ